MLGKPFQNKLVIQPIKWTNLHSHDERQLRPSNTKKCHARTCKSAECCSYFSLKPQHSSDLGWALIRVITVNVTDMYCTCKFTSLEQSRLCTWPQWDQLNKNQLCISLSNTSATWSVVNTYTVVTHSSGFTDILVWCLEGNLCQYLYPKL